MINDNQKYFDRMHVLIDALVLALSYVLSWYCYVRLGVMNNHPERGILPPATYMMALLYIVPGYLLLYYAFNLYASKRFQGRRLEFANILKANTVGFLVWLASLYMVRQVHFSRGMLCIFFVLNVTLETIVRNLIHYILSNMWKHGRNQKQILMVGYSRATEEYIDRIIANPEWGYLVRGILDDHVKAGTMYRGIKVHTQFVPDYHNIIPTKPYTEDLQGLPVVNIRYVPLSNTFNAMLKRIVDIFGALVAIILFSPVMLFSCIMIKLTSPGPLIYRQTRVGLHNKPFEMYKFRSMEVQTEEKEKKAWTVKNDPRVTGFGKFMRHTSIDELPQLFNMSLVGPRPERPFFVEKFREEIPRYMVKHQVRPGLTGWAQVNGYRGDTSIRKRIDCDLYYIENWTLGLDFKILFLTFFKGFVNKNAY